MGAVCLVHLSLVGMHVYQQQVLNATCTSLFNLVNELVYVVFLFSEAS